MTADVAMEYEKQKKIYERMQQIIQNTRPDLSQEVMAKLITPVETLEVLRDLGYVVQPLSAVQPTLRAALYTMLYGRLNDNLFDVLNNSFKNMQERWVCDKDIMFVHVFTEVQFGSFVQLATKVDAREGMNSEETLSFECLFTSDTAFNVSRLKILHSMQELTALGEKSPGLFSRENCYLLSVLTREVCNGKEETVRDYLLYVPTKCFTEFC